MLTMGPGGRFTLYGVGGPVDINDQMALMFAKLLGAEQPRLWPFAAFSKADGLAVFNRDALWSEFASQVCGVHFGRTALLTEPGRVNLAVEILLALRFGAIYGPEAARNLEVLIDRHDQAELVLFDMRLVAYVPETIKQQLTP